MGKNILHFKQKTILNYLLVFPKKMQNQFVVTIHNLHYYVMYGKPFISRNRFTFTNYNNIEKPQQFSESSLGLWRDQFKKVTIQVGRVDLMSFRGKRRREAKVSDVCRRVHIRSQRLRTPTSTILNASNFIWESKVCL